MYLVTRIHNGNVSSPPTEQVPDEHFGTHTHYRIHALTHVHTNTHTPNRNCDEIVALTTRELLSTTRGQNTENHRAIEMVYM